MLTDRYGLPLSTGSQDAADLFIDALDRIFSFDVDAMPTLERAIAADEGFAMAHAVLALQQQLQGRDAEAKGSVERSLELAAGTSSRERSFVGTVAALVAGGGVRGGATGAVPIMEAHLTEYPRDYFVFNQLNTTRNMSGARDRKQQTLTSYRNMEQVYGDDWAFNAFYAMNLQENDYFEESRRKAESSLRQRPKNANAIHPIAHTYFETNSHAEGEALLGKWLEGYEWRAPYHCHLSWHMALFSLAEGHYDRVKEIWANDIAPVERAASLLVDSASLLWRLQLYDCVPDELEWERVRPLAEAALANPALSFFFAHAALYYGAMADETTFSRMIDSLHDLEEKGHPLAGGVMKAFVMGVRAFAHADYATAASLMEPFADEFQRIGGSRAQAEVYTETYIEACLRAGFYDRAEAALRQRLKRRPSARDYFWLGRALSGSDRTNEASAALDQATDRWPSAQAESREQQHLRSLSSVEV